MLMRRAAVRALSTSSRFNSLIFRQQYNQNSLLSTSIKYTPYLAAQRLLPSFFNSRGYVTETKEKEDDQIQEGHLDATEGGAPPTAAFSESAARVRDGSEGSIHSGAAAIANAQPWSTNSDSAPRVDGGESNVPARFLYVGNLFFEVNEGMLKRVFEPFGNVQSVNIIHDARGLSKGFGYVTMERDEDAATARRDLHGTIFEGRRMMVQQAKRTGPNPSIELRKGPKNPPSKTVFVGNMSYEMTDADLNNLFKKIKNVLDVRVAIDRRTGQPRGFAHADFTDVDSAMEAVEFLQNKEFYGRKLRLDYAANPTNQSRLKQE